MIWGMVGREPETREKGRALVEDIRLKRGPVGFNREENETGSGLPRLCLYAVSQPRSPPDDSVLCPEAKCSSESDQGVLLTVLHNNAPIISGMGE